MVIKSLAFRIKYCRNKDIAKPLILALLLSSGVARGIRRYLSTMVGRATDGSYQCLECTYRNHQKRDFKRHMLLVHHFGSSELVERLDAVMNQVIFKQDAKSFSCLLCKRVLAGVGAQLTMHYINVHLDTDIPL